MAEEKKGGMTMAEAGRKGGQKVRELIEQGKRMARESAKKEQGGLDEMGNLKGRSEE